MFIYIAICKSFPTDVFLQWLETNSNLYSFPTDIFYNGLKATQFFKTKNSFMCILFILFLEVLLLKDAP